MNNDRLQAGWGAYVLQAANFRTRSGLMDYLISWAASAIGGSLSVVFLVIGWAAIPASIMAVIGAIRRRCRWYAILIYLLLIPIGSFLFRGVFWVLERVAQPDTVSTTLFWCAVFTTGLGALFGAGPTLLKKSGK